MNIIKRTSLIPFLLMLTACSAIKPQATPSTLEAKIQQSRVVLIGETHTDYGHHLNQLKVIKQMHKKWGGVLTIGLEMVQQPFQSVLDKYIEGSISEREMLRDVEWYSRWRYDFRLYRSIFAYAKRYKIPLIALNIPQELTKRISKVGIKNLSATERQQLPAIIDRSNANYTARLRKVFGMHAHGKTFNETRFSKFVDAQLAWDEGMAFAASNYLKQNPNKRMAILAGSGHLKNREGIPSRIDRQLKLNQANRSVVVLSHADKLYSKQEADISFPSKLIELPPLGLIGIGMKDSAQGVKISMLSKSGAAEKAGLQKGDLLLKLNDVSVKTSSDVSLWRLDKMPNEKIRVLIRRDKQQLSKTLVLGSPTKTKP